VNDRKVNLAVLFGKRGSFPGEYISEARASVLRAIAEAGMSSIYLNEESTPYGAIETIQDGKKFDSFLKENRGNYDGILLCLPNFGDENGILAALKNADAPILVHAFPDKIGEMNPLQRRDAMCGKFAACNVLRQANIPYTLTKRFVVSPDSEAFQTELKRFASVCRVVRGMRSFNIGAFGARTTPFKTVRIDEIALQKKGINVETLDLSEIFSMVRGTSERRMREAEEKILSVATFSGYPEEKLHTLAKVQAAFEDVIDRYDLQGVAVRCWNEFETELQIAPCVCLSVLNEMGIPAACEVDVSNAVLMRAFHLASETPSALLDFNNNYGDADDKAILFHCGPIPLSMMEGKGEIKDHMMLRNLGEGNSVGVNIGKIRSGKITIGSLKTENGELESFVTDGVFTEDPIEEEFFGCGKVMRRENIDTLANFMAREGYKHHLCVTFGDYADVIQEAFTNYLGYGIKVL